MNMTTLCVSDYDYAYDTELFVVVLFILVVFCSFISGQVFGNWNVTKTEQKKDLLICCSFLD